MADTDRNEEGTQFPGLKADSVSDPAPRPPEAPEAPARPSRLAEPPPRPILVPRRALTQQTRRDFLIYGVGAAAAAAGLWWALPPETQQGLGARHAATTPGKDRILNKALHFDDDVAEALYRPDRRVPTFDRALALPPETLRDNYDGPDPDALHGDYVPHWKMTVKGLASGRRATLTLRDIAALTERFGRHDQVTRLVCVEGWSAIAWWSGLRFADFLQAFPPAPDAKWVRLDSSYNVGTDSDGNPVSDPYYVSLDLPTARHPQTLLATHQSDRPLTVPHGAPLRLIAPMKLGLKNIKAITQITYTATVPADYWQERGYSQYDGL